MKKITFIFISFLIFVSFIFSGKEAIAINQPEADYPSGLITSYPIEFRWSEVDQASEGYEYRIYSSGEDICYSLLPTNSEFENCDKPVIIGRTLGLDKTTDTLSAENEKKLLLGKTYYWRVRACKDYDNTDPTKSECSDFSFPSKSFILGLEKAVLSSPGDGEEAYFPIILKWEKVEGATSYLLRVTKKGDPSDTKYSIVIPGLSRVIPSGKLEPEGRYDWSIQPQRPGWSAGPAAEEPDRWWFWARLATPEPVSPDGDAYFPIVLEWNLPPGAAEYSEYKGYQWVIEKGGQKIHSFFEEGATTKSSSEITKKSGLLSVGETYSWYVMSCQAMDKRCGPPSESLTFTVKEGVAPTEKSITVKYPNGGETLQTGKSYTIEWQSTGIDDFCVDLVRGPGDNPDLAKRFDCNIKYDSAGNKYPATIPSNQEEGTDYRIRVAEDGITIGVKDFSDDYFTISKEAPPAVKPAAPEIISPKPDVYVSLPAVLKWRPVEEAKTYQYQVFKDPNFLDWQTGGFVKDKVCIIITPPPGEEEPIERYCRAVISDLGSGKTYWWRVKACSTEPKQPPNYSMNEKYCSFWTQGAFTTETAPAPTLKISPFTVKVYNTTQLEAYYDPDGDWGKSPEKVTLLADWSTDDYNIAVVDNEYDKGWVICMERGITGIRATYSGIESVAYVDCAPEEVAPGKPPAEKEKPAPTWGIVCPSKAKECKNCIQNPLCAESFDQLIDAIINFIYWLAIAIAPIMFIIAGFYFVTAVGDPNKIATAKKIILYTAIGLVIVLLAKGLIAMIESILVG